MRRIVLAAVVLVAALAGPLVAQTASPSPEALAAARDLVAANHATDQFRAVLPTLIQNLKAMVVQNRPEVEKQYDALIPIFLQKAQAHLDTLTDDVAVIYANNFTVDELHDLAAFYRSPTGQKLVQRQPAIAQQSMVAGQQLGREIARDVVEEMKGTK
ncbi:MAG TPA: DUF2059 domain-containing protein [Xanthobacteraceae bacterium]|nr:DUF2059 domain-containing protein [Xanthobacteraceae bacterium]